MSYCRDRCVDRNTRQTNFRDDDDDDDEDDRPTQDYNQGRRTQSKQSGFDFDPVLMDLEGNAYQRIRMTNKTYVVVRDGYGMGMTTVQSRNSIIKDRPKVKTVTSNANILTERNPDIFATPPRPGGFLKITPKEDAPKSEIDFVDVCERCTSVYDQEVELRRKKGEIPDKQPSKNLIRPVQRETESREFRIRRALEDNDWETTVIDETDTIVGFSNPYHLGMNMLAVTITCIMMMASKIEMSIDYLEWAENYLKCIKDENSKLPRNIAGLLKEIEKAKSTAIASDTKTYKRKLACGKKRSDQGCRVVCGMNANKSLPGQCTLQSSCTMNKNLCSGLRPLNPCPNMKPPKCDIRCGHIATIDDYVSPTPSQRDKKHL